jgi:hypothetical protein
MPEIREIALATDSPTPTGGVGSVGNTNLPSTLAGPQFSGETAAWEGILVVEGVVTGDGREFSAGSLTWPDPVGTLLPISWQKASIGGHDGSVVVARIDQMWRDPADPTIIRASGVFDLGSVDGAEAYRQVKDGFLSGISVDVDSIKDSDVELVYPPTESTGEDGQAAEDDSLAMLFGPPPDKTVFHAGRVRGATLVALPAFVEAQIALVAQQPALTASASNVCQQVNRIAPHLRKSGEFDVTLGARQIGLLLSSPALKMSAMQRHAIYQHLASHLTELGLTAQPFSLNAMSDEVRMSLIAAGDTVTIPRPPTTWFHDPELAGQGGLVIEDPSPEFGGLRRIYGYAAHFGTCHIAYPDACVTAPHESNHDHYMLGDVLTADGDHVSVGSITLGTGHASTFGIGAREATEHYDNTGTAVADVAVGNDEFGIWVAGYVRPGVAEAKVNELRAAKLSGDWRRLGGKLRLVALLAVNVPGFPVPRTSINVKFGVQTSLVAAGIDAEAGRPSASELDALRRMKLRLAADIGRDPASRKAALREAVHQTGV